jgi:hypothetical protein
MTSQNEVFGGRPFPAGDVKTSLTEWRVQAEPELDTTRATTSPQRVEDVTPEVFVEQIRLLYQHPVLILVNIVNAALVVAVLWSSFPHPPLLAWIALFLPLDRRHAAAAGPAREPHRRSLPHDRRADAAGSDPADHGQPRRAHRPVQPLLPVRNHGA